MTAQPDVDLNDVLVSIKNVIIGEIKAGKKINWDDRFAQYCKRYDSQYKGLMMHYQNSKDSWSIPLSKSTDDLAPLQVEPKNGQEEAPSAIPATKPSLPQIAKDHFNALAQAEKDFSVDQLTNLYWDAYKSPAVEGLEEEDKVRESIMIAQSQAAYFNSFPSGTFRFYPWSITGPKKIVMNKKVQKEGAEEGHMVSKRTETWRGDIYGFFQELEDNNVVKEGAGTVTCWTEKAAKSLTALKPLQGFTTTFEGKWNDKQGQYVLSLREETQFQSLNESVDEDTLALMIIKSLQQSKLIKTVDSIPGLDLGEKGISVVLEARIAKNSGVRESKDGNNYLSLNVTPAGLSTKPTSYSVTFFENLDQIVRYGENSTVYLGCFIKKGKGEYADKPNINGNFIIPIRKVAPVNVQNAGIRSQYGPQ